MNWNLLFLKNILKKSDSIINQWGGKLYFVYLPPYEIYKGYEPIYNDTIWCFLKKDDNTGGYTYTSDTQ